ncbi:MAG TPA: Asp-tRNA(Asn)/Glu-tRNA(Gln) amidotransferase GatCAB subunit A [Rhodobacteraceae bacterium]|jgi:amidase|nr:Asp-tRNA(Asn)/Glu-tRNA(Gln) amidotransferase GatCAB subunit A [Paracoccaceae bacterium]|tara:strand:- start:4689 stop:6122 length:1434 start_codon:yes stop_codon:yes gene_type:complete
MNKILDAEKREELHFKSLLEVSTLVRNRCISSVELTESLLRRIESLDGRQKSYATVMADHALAAAERADKELTNQKYRGPLHGIPIAVKDVFFTRDVRTMGGTAVLADHIPNEDATVVKRLAEAGAVLMGKLNLPEGAMAGYNPLFDIPLNPWNPGVWSGASSSGSGVATAAGLAYGTLGSDTGGSIRFPAACCGVVGLKPTWGRVSRYGVLALAESMDHVGPITRRTADAAVILQAIAGHDSKDPTSLPVPVPDMLKHLEVGVKGVRIGFDEQATVQHTDGETAQAVEAGVRVLEQLGAEVIEIQLPDLDEFLPAWPILCSAEAVLAHESNYPCRREEYAPYFRQWLDMGAKVSGAEYARANNLRANCNGRFREIFETIDVLACPSMTGPPWPVTRKESYGGLPRDPSVQRFTIPFDFNGNPTLSVPCGINQDGLPLSLQFVGHPLKEPLLCQVGHAYEQATEWHILQPNLEGIAK